MKYVSNTLVRALLSIGSPTSGIETESEHPDFHPQDSFFTVLAIFS